MRCSARCVVVSQYTPGEHLPLTGPTFVCVGFPPFSVYSVVVEQVGHNLPLREQAGSPNTWQSFAQQRERTYRIKI